MISTAVALWCVLLVLAPLLAHMDLVAPSGILYLFFSKICHQQASRSFFIFGKQMAVCSRCTALYFGFLFGTLLYPLLQRTMKDLQPPKILLLFAAIPIVIDFSLGGLGILENTFLTRSITGLILGSVVAFYIIPGLKNIFMEFSKK
jgi:uncharacterized membrane protein